MCERLTDEQRKLAEANMNLVYYVISRRFGPQMLKNEDMVSDGYVGLCKAASIFDPTRGVKFCTLATTAIYHEIASRIRHDTRYKKYIDSAPVSLNQRVDMGEGEGGELVDFISDPTVDIEHQAETKILYDAIKHMAPTYCDILERGVNMAEYARQVKKSKQRISAVCNSELEKARHDVKYMHLTA